MKKSSYLRLASLACALIILFAIWQFSAQSAADSSSLSDGLAGLIISLPIGKEWTVSWLTRCLRKLAHFCLYMALGMSLSGAVLQWRWWRVLGTVLATGILSAMIDEWHQSFVPGRGPSWLDVLLDSCGVLAGIILMLGLRWCYWRYMKRKYTKSSIQKVR